MILSIAIPTIVCIKSTAHFTIWLWSDFGGICNSICSDVIPVLRLSMIWSQFDFYFLTRKLKCTTILVVSNLISIQKLNQEDDVCMILKYSSNLHANWIALRSYIVQWALVISMAWAHIPPLSLILQTSCRKLGEIKWAVQIKGKFFHKNMVLILFTIVSRNPFY